MSSTRTDFVRPVRRAGAMGVIGVERTQAIRLYCEQHDESWRIQVRGPRMKSNFHEGKEFMVAGASLSKDDLLALRDAIDTLLKEAEQ